MSRPVIFACTPGSVTASELKSSTADAPFPSQVPIKERERLLLKAGLDPAELTNLTLVYQDPLTQVC